MITRAEEPRRGRVLRIAIVGSLLAHLLVGILFIAASDEARRLLSHFDVRHSVKKPDDETVSMSQTLRIEKRTVPNAGGGKPPPAHRPVPPRPQVRPAPQAVAQIPHPVVVPKPVRQRPALLKHEIAKAVPHATAEPVKTTKAKTASETPTAPPASPEPAKQIASLQRPSRVTEPQRPSRAVQLSQAQIAQIDRDLSKTIAKARAAVGTLSDVRKRVVPSSTRRYAMDFSGVGKDLRHAQGICHPIKSWQSAGWNYYYDSCEVQEPDGSLREKALPWPVRYRPAADPNLGTGPDPAPVVPVPGWQPDPSRPLDPDFVPYLRANGFSV